MNINSDLVYLIRVDWALKVDGNDELKLSEGSLYFVLPVTQITKVGYQSDPD